MTAPAPTPEGQAAIMRSADMFLEAKAVLAIVQRIKAHREALIVADPGDESLRSRESKVALMRLRLAINSLDKAFFLIDAAAASVERMAGSTSDVLDGGAA